ncbi:MFS transporter [Saprospiraceae bacterium]|nr:MFS transporter [Saprospiraceae bacterium]
MSEKPKSNSKLLFIIFITAFIDLLGVGIIIPIIPALFFEGDGFLVGAYSENTTAVLYGFLLAAYPLMQFFGAPVLGALSDKYGRKPVLSIALIGTFVGYLLFAYGVLNQNLWLLYIGRLLPGFTGGNISIVTSSIADISDKESRTKNFGLVGMAFGLGFVIGPSIGGILSDPSILPWFDLHVPFVFTAILTLVNIILVQLNFRETLKEKIATKVNVFKGIENIFTSFLKPELRSVFTIVLLLSVGFTFYTNFFSAYLYLKFDFSTKDVGFLYGYVGIWLAFTQGFLVRIMSKKFKPKQILVFSIPLLALGLGMIMLPTKGWMFYLVNPIVAIFYGLTFPNMTSLVSSQVDETLQGSILGINQSMSSFGQVLTISVGGFILAQGITFPLIASSSIIFLAFIVFLFTKHRMKYDS